MQNCHPISLLNVDYKQASRTIASFSGFFWKDKKVIVARSVVVQAPSLGGFSAVDVKLKVQSLLVQWVRCFILASSTGVSVSFRL